jgi:hypothetical protein
MRATSLRGAPTKSSTYFHAFSTSFTSFIPVSLFDDLAKRTWEVARREEAATAADADLQAREQKLAADTAAVEQLRADLQRRLDTIRSAAAA